MGAYQPRTRRATIADSLQEFRRATAQFFGTVLFRGSGLLLMLGSFAGLAALASYNPADGSLNNATGRVSLNWLQGPGATGV